MLKIKNNTKEKKTLRRAMILIFIAMVSDTQSGESEGVPSSSYMQWSNILRSTLAEMFPKYEDTNPELGASPQASSYSSPRTEGQSIVLDDEAKSLFCKDLTASEALDAVEKGSTTSSSGYDTPSPRGAEYGQTLTTHRSPTLFTEIITETGRILGLASLENIQYLVNTANTALKEAGKENETDILSKMLFLNPTYNLPISNDQFQRDKIGVINRIFTVQNILKEAPQTEEIKYAQALVLSLREFIDSLLVDDMPLYSPRAVSEAGDETASIEVLNQVLDSIKNILRDRGANRFEIESFLQALKDRSKNILNREIIYDLLPREIDIMTNLHPNQIDALRIFGYLTDIDINQITNATKFNYISKKMLCEQRGKTAVRHIVRTVLQDKTLIDLTLRDNINGLMISSELVVHLKDLFSPLLELAPKYFFRPANYNFEFKQATGDQHSNPLFVDFILSTPNNNRRMLMTFFLRGDEPRRITYFHGVSIVEDGLVGIFYPAAFFFPTKFEQKPLDSDVMGELVIPPSRPRALSDQTYEQGHPLLLNLLPTVVPEQESLDPPTLGGPWADTGPREGLTREDETRSPRGVGYGQTFESIISRIRLNRCWVWEYQMDALIGSFDERKREISRPNRDGSRISPLNYTQIDLLSRLKEDEINTLKANNFINSHDLEQIKEPRKIRSLEKQFHELCYNRKIENAIALIDDNADLLVGEGKMNNGIRKRVRELIRDNDRYQVFIDLAEIKQGDLQIEDFPTDQPPLPPPAMPTMLGPTLRFSGAAASSSGGLPPIAATDNAARIAEEARKNQEDASACKAEAEQRAREAAAAQQRILEAARKTEETKRKAEEARRLALPHSQAFTIPEEVVVKSATLISPRNFFIIKDSSEAKKPAKLLFKDADAAFVIHDFGTGYNKIQQQTNDDLNPVKEGNIDQKKQNA